MFLLAAPLPFALIFLFACVLPFFLSRSVVRAFLIEEQKIVKQVLLEKQKKKKA